MNSLIMSIQKRKKTAKAVAKSTVLFYVIILMAKIMMCYLLYMENAGTW